MDYGITSNPLKKTNAFKYEPIGKKNIFEKKIPTNSKYNGIKTTLNTGFTQKNLEVLSDKLISKRKSELFTRVDGDFILKLLKIDNNVESIYNLTEKEASTVICNEEKLAEYKSPYLILDIRDPSLFKSYHIKEAISYPSMLINQDKYPKELQSFVKKKNQPSKPIIIYGLDEKEGSPIAQLLHQKGFNNIHLLTGGIEKFAQKYKEEVVGEIPLNLAKVEVGKKIMVRSNKENLEEGGKKEGGGRREIKGRK